MRDIFLWARRLGTRQSTSWSVDTNAGPWCLNTSLSCGFRRKWWSSLSFILDKRWLAPVTASKIFNALAFAVAGCLFKVLDKNNNEVEIRRHNLAHCVTDELNLRPLGTLDVGARKYIWCEGACGKSGDREHPTLWALRHWSRGEKLASREEKKNCRTTSGVVVRECRSELDKQSVGQFF